MEVSDKVMVAAGLRGGDEPVDEDAVAAFGDADEAPIQID